MFIVSLLLFFSGLTTILFESKSLPSNPLSWLFGALLIGISLPFFIGGILAKKRIHQEGHHSLP